jgi:hypothetical protein
MSDLFESGKAGQSAPLPRRQESIVLHVLSWSLVFVLFALWSLAAWALDSVASWIVSNAGFVAGGSGAIEGLRLPDWLAPWIPPELALAFTSMLSSFIPAIEAALQQAPALAGGLSVAIWVVWGLGGALIVILGLVCSGLIKTLRRRASVIAAPSVGPARAG